MSELDHRSRFLVQIFEKYVDKDDHILEIGSGDGRNLKFLKDAGYKNVTGIDKMHGEPIEDYPEKLFDTIYTMSTLFLIPPENEWVFEKIARMAKKYIITVEGETTASWAYNPDGRGVFGRDYSAVFKPYGFEEVFKMDNVFNQFGVARVLKHI